MMTKWQARPGDVDALPEAERPEQAGARVAGELPDEGGDLVLALAEDGDLAVEVLEPLAHLVGRGACGTHRREEAERAPAGSPDEGLDLVHGLGRGAVAARWREVLGDVGDALLRVVEGAADVEAGPRRRTLAAQADRAGDGVEGAAEPRGWRR